MERDLNLSAPVDLLEVNLHAMRRGGRDRYVAEDATIPEGADVRESVVLAGARLEDGVRLQRCLVLPGERVRAGTYDRVIFLNGKEISCDGSRGAGGGSL